MLYMKIYLVWILSVLYGFFFFPNIKICKIAGEMEPIKQCTNCSYIPPCKTSVMALKCKKCVHTSYLK